MLGGTANEIGHAYLRFNVFQRLDELKTNHSGDVEKVLRRARITPELIACIERDGANLSQETLLGVLTKLNSIADINLELVASKEESLVAGQIF